MIKVLYLIDTLKTGGAEKSLVDIAINNSSIKSVFVTIYGGNDFETILVDNNIPYFDLSIKKRYGFFEASNKLQTLVAEIKPDVIHSTLFRADILARMLRSKIEIPLISSFVNNSYISDRFRKLSLIGKIKLKSVQYIDRFTSRNVDFFISNSETIKDSNAAFLSVDRSKIQVIYRGRKIDDFKYKLHNSEKLKSSLRLNDGSFVFLNVSRLLERKGQLDLITAFEKVVNKYPQAVLLIAGEGGYRTILETQCKLLNLQNNIRFLGNRNDIPELLQLADSFVFPSYYEGLPGALIEAMLSAKTIICSDIPENRECVTTKEAIIFSKGDIQGLSNRMNEVLEESELFKELGENALKVAVNKFDINSVVNQYNDLYAKIKVTGKK